MRMLNFSFLFQLLMEIIMLAMINSHLHNSFLPCYYFCNVPADSFGAWYLFI